MIYHVQHRINNTFIVSPITGKKVDTGICECCVYADTPQQAEQIAIARYNVKDVMNVSLDCMYTKEHTPENDFFFTVCLHRDGVLIPDTFDKKKSNYIRIRENVAAKW
jgi:uncharacterized cysteine cluster protein YcgN (CxxCxxCC family)